MLFKNVAGQKAIVYAYDAAADAPKTGDAANITATISKDAQAPAASSDVNPTEIGGGLYAFDLSQAETDCDLLAICATSATSNVRIDSVVAYTQAGAIPKAVAGGAGGLPLADSVSAIKAKTDLIVVGGVTIQSPVVSATELEIVRGDDHLAAHGAALEWTDVGSTWPDLTGATVTLTIRDKRTDALQLSQVGTVIPGPPAAVRFEPSRADTAEMLAGHKRHWFDVQATLADGSIRTLTRGEATVWADQTR